MQRLSSSLSRDVGYVEGDSDADDDIVKFATDSALSHLPKVCFPSILIVNFLVSNVGFCSFFRAKFHEIDAFCLQTILSISALIPF